MKSVPFSISNVYCCGLGECHGLLKDEGTHLCLEYQVHLGPWRGRPKSVRVPIKDLESVNVRTGWFGATAVTLQATSLQAIGHVPGSRQGKVELRVDRKNRVLAEELVAGLHEV